MTTGGISGDQAGQGRGGAHVEQDPVRGGADGSDRLYRGVVLEGRQQARVVSGRAQARHPYLATGAATLGRRELTIELVGHGVGAIGEQRRTRLAAVFPARRAPCRDERPVGLVATDL